MQVVYRLLILIGCLLAAPVIFVWMFFTAFSGGQRFVHIALGLDNAASACFGGDGFVTISHRAKLARRTGKRWGCVLCRILDSLQKDHCERS